jgi:adenylate cyclase
MTGDTSSRARSATGGPSLVPFYWTCALTTTIGIVVVFILNMATPFGYVQEIYADLARRHGLDWGWALVRRLGGLVGLTGGVCLLAATVIHVLARPIAACLRAGRLGHPVDPEGLEAARRRILNLPFLFIPINIGLWVVVPAFMFMGTWAGGGLAWRPAVVLAVRASLVGLVSSTLAFFLLEQLARRRLIPFFFPQGRLTRTGGAARLNVSRRIRAVYRLGSLIPMFILVVTLATLQWQVDSSTVSAASYGRGILVFVIVLAGVFFVTAGFLNRLVSRSIARPVEDMLAVVRRVRDGDFSARITVVGNDEIGVLGDAGNEMIRGLAERELLRDAFGRYVSPQIRDEVLAGRVPLDGAAVEVTVLFADLRDFTPLTEAHDPKLVVELVNRYFEAMTEAVHREGGLVLQFLGDEIYAVFGAPVALPDHPARGFRAALSMREKLAELNAALAAEDRPTLRQAMGLHSGRAVAANLGSAERKSYLLIGDTINLAARLQTLARDLGADLVLSRATRDQLGPDDLARAELETLPRTTVKGRREPVEVFALR